MPPQPQPDDTGTGTPAEGTAGAEGAADEAAQAAAVAAAAAEGGEQGAEGGAAAGAEGAPPVEKTPEEQAAEKAKADEAEAAIKAAAEKYAKDQIAQANRTMAAARRTEKATADVKTENEALKKTVATYDGFLEQLKASPMKALARLGFGSFKDFAQHVVDTGGEREPTEEERIDAIVAKRLKEREAPTKKAEQEAAIKESQAAVFAYVDENKEKYTRTATRIGKRELWDAITTYVDKHGTCPDEAVIYLADQVERDMRAELGEPIPPGPGDKKGKPANGAAASGASSSGESLAGKPTSGAPVVKKLSLDPDERRAQVNEELRAQGLL